MKLPTLCLLACGLVFSCGAAQAQTSVLWGTSGEKWSATGRLTDWSFAGYHSGETAIPTPPVKASVRDFGAVGDGQTDDTAAFKRAIAGTENGALFVPAGRYLITDILYIRASHLVLRGEGPGRSVLVFPRGLEEVKPSPDDTSSGQPTSGYSWSGGFIWVEGNQLGKPVGEVTAAAGRGTHQLKVANAARVTVGQRVQVTQQDPGDGSLLQHLYTGQSGNVSKIPPERVRTTFVSRVTGVDGDTLTLQRPLRTDIDPRWKASVATFEPSVQEVGIEDLGFVFPEVPYKGHFTEVGYNPLTFVGGISDCWARNLHFQNADSGPFVRGNFITVEKVSWDSTRPSDKQGHQGHHGFTMGHDTLLKDFDFRVKFIHDITASMVAGSVAMRGKGVDISFDHHKRYPHANLYTDIDLGKGTRMFKSGGGANLGRHAGAWTTWWNIRGQAPQNYPAEAVGPDSMTLVGVLSAQPALQEPAGRWYEPLTETGLQPANLYEAQLAKRLGNNEK